MSQHQRGPLDLLNDLGHGERLARTGDAQQNLLVQTAADSLCQRRNGLRLVPGGGVGRVNFKFRHDDFPRVSEIPASAALACAGKRRLYYTGVLSKMQHLFDIGRPRVSGALCQASIPLSAMETKSPSATMM